MKIRMKQVKWIAGIVRRMPKKMMAYIGVGLTVLYIIRLVARARGRGKELMA